MTGKLRIIKKKQTVIELSDSNDYEAVNLGQHKTVAKPFCDVLIRIDYTLNYKILFFLFSNRMASSRL